MLITLDKGICNTRTYSPARYAGIILVRLKSPSRASVMQLVETHLSTLIRANLTGHFAVVSAQGVRIG